jgi:transcription elongation factor GreA
VAEDRVALTREGMTKLHEELDYLRDVRRPEVAQTLEQARETNLSTEAEPGYEFAKEEQAGVENRIAQLEHMLGTAEVIDEAAVHHSDRVRLGSTVVVKSNDSPDQTFQIVDPVEVDVKEGKISEESPVGHALMGHSVGETVVVSAPHGERRLKITWLT